MPSRPGFAHNPNRAVEGDQSGGGSLPALPRSRPFLERLRAPADPAEAHRVEIVLARARTILASCALIAIYLDPSAPSRFARLTYLLLTIYVAHSLLVFLLLHGRQQVPPGLIPAVHTADILWPAVITMFTEGPTSPFFVLFSFALLAAAYRWGFRETMMTASVTVSLLFAEIILVTVAGYGPLFVEGQFELDRSIMRSTYLVLMGLLLGYLAEQEKQLRAETAVVARVIRKAQVELGLRDTLREVLGEFLQLFDASHLLLATKDITSQRTFLWEVRRAPGAPEASIHLAEIESERGSSYFSESPAPAWFLARREEGGFEQLALDAEGRRLQAPDLSLPEAFLTLHPFQSLFTVSFTFGEEWLGRLFVFDPGVGGSRERELRFQQTLLRQVAPAIYSVYLLRRLRARAGAMERARVARELHDGALQSLIAVEMQVDVLRRQATAQEPALAEGLAQIQQQLRQEVLGLRELMEQMTPVNLMPPQLLDFLADQVEKFRRSTGIRATFLCEPEEVSLPPRVCREVARIVQEALVNVRKHSGAQNVLVHFAAQKGQWKLVIDDDGCGFPFSGRLTLAELDAERKGPLVIKERVRALGGEVTIESAPGRGARLEITLP